MKEVFRDPQGIKKAAAFETAAFFVERGKNMKKRSFLTAFAALMMALMMLCGCSESVGYEEAYSSQSASETTVYIEASAIEEEKEETISEEVTSTELDEKQEENAVNETVSEEIASANLDEKLEETSAETEKAVQRYYFRSEKLFDSHYEKHGAEFGDITQEEYLDLANELINAEGDYILHKTEKEDGDFLYYDTETNEFLVLSTDGYIRTFFKPSAGIDYWERQ